MRSFELGMFSTNCYIIADADSRDALIIDPGEEADTLIEAVRSDDINVLGIVNTHGHADHIAANGAVKGEFRCPIIVHTLDSKYLLDSDLNLSAFIGSHAPLSPPADKLVDDGDEIAIGDLAFKVIHTPGHTPGGICLYMDGILFSGDTLFAGSIGRADFPGGSHQQLVESIQSKLMILPNDTIVYPGHGPRTTIGSERLGNPFL